MIGLRSEVLKANRTFYEVFRLGDYARMDLLWSQDEGVSVFHPGWDGIHGRGDVMESWYRLMVLGDPPPIYCYDETVILNGSKAIVFCTEEMGNAECIGSNIFVYEARDWRLRHHQATPLPGRNAR